MSRPLNLYRLQQIDSRIDQANARLKEIAALLADNAQVRRAAAQAAKTKASLEAARKERQQAQNKVKDQRIKIEQTEATLYSGTVRNPKELQDLQNEVAALKRFLDTLEERYLEAMLIVDDANETNDSAQKILSEVQAEAEEQSASLIQEREQLQNDAAAAEKQRQSAARAVDPDDLVVYEQMRKKRAGVAVAKVRGKACSACGSTLAASLNQAARSPSQMVFCDSCGRILYSA